MLLAKNGLTQRPKKREGSSELNKKHIVQDYVKSRIFNKFKTRWNNRFIVTTATSSADYIFHNYLLRCPANHYNILACPALKFHFTDF